MDTISTTSSYSDGAPPTLALPMYSPSQSHGSGGAGSISHHPLTSTILAQQQQQYPPVQPLYPSLASSLASSQHSSGSSPQVEIAAEGEMGTSPSPLPMGSLNSITLTEWLNINKTNKKVVELQNAIIEKIQIENAKWLLRSANDSMKTLIATKMTKKERNDNPPLDLFPPIPPTLSTTQMTPGQSSTLHAQPMPVQMMPVLGDQHPDRKSVV